MFFLKKIQNFPQPCDLPRSYLVCQFSPLHLKPASLGKLSLLRPNPPRGEVSNYLERQISTHHNFHNPRIHNSIKTEKKIRKKTAIIADSFIEFTVRSREWQSKLEKRVCKEDFFINCTNLDFHWWKKQQTQLQCGIWHNHKKCNSG